MHEGLAVLGSGAAGDRTPQGRGLGAVDRVTSGDERRSPAGTHAAGERRLHRADADADAPGSAPRARQENTERQRRVGRRHLHLVTRGTFGSRRPAVAPEFGEAVEGGGHEISAAAAVSLVDRQDEHAKQFS
ncbi:MAG TPA: hypothetical protein DEA59_05010 [Microbacterium sp.]|nr:hypothetical protein [Microbacterium sp.]HBR88614.1 hypothetical protein [Microbacterium sp.]HBS76159.1 hypothetical protein [Microbacterium sp.]